MTARGSGIIHRDVNGKCLALLLLFALSLGCLQLAMTVPARVVQGAVPGAVSARTDTGRPASVRPAAAVLGLDYMVPGKGAGAGDLDQLRDSGQLRGYSLPARMLAFTPDGNFIYIPAWPKLSGPRDVRVFFHGTRGRKRVALTFDTSEVAERSASRALLDALTRLRAPATFFVCGQWCERNPGLLREMVARGFEVGSHSWNHPRFATLTNEAAVEQLRATEESFRRLTGRDIAAYFRPPYGENEARVQLLAASRGYTTVMWERDTLDWEAATTPDQIFSRATDGVSGGEIILMHTLGQYTAGTLERIAGALRLRGFELTTVSGVLEP